MKLSAKLIVHELSKQVSLQTSKSLSAQPHLKYPVFYQKHRPLMENLLYIVEDSDFNADDIDISMDSSMIIIMGDNKNFDHRLNRIANICIIKDPATSSRIFQILQEFFQVYNAWTQNLSFGERQSDAIEHLLELSKFAIPNPMFVVGMDFRVYGAVQVDFQNLHDNMFGSDEETSVVVTSLAHDKNYEEALNKTGVFYFPGNDYAIPSLCRNIRINGKTEARLLVTEGEIPLDNTLDFLIEYLGRIIELAIQTSPGEISSSFNTRTRIFKTLLTDPKADYVEISNSLTDIGWLVSHHYICIVFKPNYSDIKNMTLNSIATFVENNIPESCALLHKDCVVAFINESLCTYSASTIRQKIAVYVRESLLTAGYSRSLMGHFNFYRQYQQAKLCIAIGSEKYPDQWIHYFNDIAMPFMADQITRKLPAYMTCHEGLMNLKYQDQDNGSAYYETLRCFLNNNQNATKTAADLFIHRSTLLYRLDYIKKFLKSDLKEPQEILYLQLSYYLLEG